MTEVHVLWQAAQETAHSPKELGEVTTALLHRLTIETRSHYVALAGLRFIM